MFVVYQPGGTITDAIVVLHGDDKIPSRYNVNGTIVYWDDDEDGGKRYLIKDKTEILPCDSKWLSQPELPKVDILDLTKPENRDKMFEHQDIISLDEPEKEKDATTD